MNCAADVLELLNEQVAAVRLEKSVKVPERARLVGFLAGTILKALEVGQMAARLEALEQVLRKRERAAA